MMVLLFFSAGQPATILIMSRGITALWIAISLLFTLAVIFASVSPEWFENQDKVKLKNNTVALNVSFGPLRFCTRKKFPDAILSCDFYRSLVGIPSITWILCTVVYAVGCALLLVALICSCFGCCSDSEKWERIRLGCAYLQLFGGMNYV